LSRWFPLLPIQSDFASVSFVQFKSWSGRYHEWPFQNGCT